MIRPLTDLELGEIRERVKRYQSNIYDPQADIVESEYDACALLRHIDALPKHSQWVAVREQKLDAWTYPYEFLGAVEKAMAPDDFAPSMEGIELVLLAYEKVMGRGIPLPAPPVTAEKL